MKYQMMSREELIVRMEEMEKVIEDLRKEKETDFLQLNLKSHSAIIELLKEEMDKSSIKDEPLCIIIFDIDDLKTVNARFGYLFGDHIILQVARVIKRNLRAKDHIGRYGGEEFLLVLNKTTKENAKLVGERIRRAIEIYPFDEDLSITVSGGLACFDRLENEEITVLLRRTDALVDQSKKNGKNRLES